MFQPFDVTDERMVNIAMFHIRKDIGRDEAFVQALSRNARFVVGDKCFQHAPMFTGNDVSLQHIEGGKRMGVVGKIRFISQKDIYVLMQKDCQIGQYLPREYC